MSVRAPQIMPVSATLGPEQSLGERLGDGDKGRVKHSRDSLELFPGLFHTQTGSLLRIFKFSKRTAALAKSSALTTLPSISRESQKQDQDSKAEEGEGPHSQEPQCHGVSVQNEPPKPAREGHRGTRGEKRDFSY